MLSMMIRKVLLVDDEADIRKIAALALSRVGGWEVVQADSGGDAVRAAQKELPDVILLDVMMPGMDGPATLAELRANPTTAAIPVIFVTAKIKGPERERIALLGVAGIISKPFDAMRLPDEIRVLIEAKAE